MGTRHKVFVSYHHANDESRKNIFNLRFGNKYDILVRGSVELGDIDENLPAETIRRKIRDEYLRDSSVTVVLIGVQTWQRKHVDWEIAASLRHTVANPRSGLLGIVLPSYYEHYRVSVYDRYTVPPRLIDNVDAGFAEIYDWSEDAEQVQRWIHAAYVRKATAVPNNSRDLFAYNRSSARWNP